MAVAHPVVRQCQFISIIGAILVTLLVVSMFAMVVAKQMVEETATVWMAAHQVHPKVEALLLVAVAWLDCLSFLLPQ